MQGRLQGLVQMCVKEGETSYCKQLTDCCQHRAQTCVTSHPCVCVLPCKMKEAVTKIPLLALIPIIPTW
jgi:hypothetical protein